MSSADQQDVLRHMIMSFRVSELQMLLGFAGRNKNGKKHELQSRALDLVKIRSTPMQAKIRELYKASQQAQMMQGQQGGGMQGYPPGIHYGSQGTAAAAAMGLYGGQGAAAAALQGRNPYTTGAGTGYAGSGGSSALYGSAGAPAAPYGSAHQLATVPRHPGGQAVPQHPDLKFVRLPFFDVHAELLKPTSLVAQSNNRFQEAQFQFFLTPQQATDVASSRDVSVGQNHEYLYQIQLRFCQYSPDASKEVSDEFPPSVCVQINGKMATLPNPIPTNKPGVEPKRPPRPVHISQLCKLSPILPNNVNIKWAAEFGKGWVVGIWLVMKLSSKDLLDRLKKKGICKSEFTRKLIIDKLNDDEEVATTSVKVSVSCPLGKMRMQVPCRPAKCSHLQCFDASLFLQMNERKPTWNCPVCDAKAPYDQLQIDGYFQEVLQSKDLPKDENEILLETDGNWRPVPKEDEKTKPPSSLPPSTTDKGGSGNDASANGTGAGAGGGVTVAEDVECIDLSDDDDAAGVAAAPPPPLPSANSATNPPLPPGPPSYGPPPPLGAGAAAGVAGGAALPLPPLPPLPPQEIECIDLD